ncbi:inorganic pyrophosphatase [Haloplanus vescus]|uniref:Inorganic pyrophosphatase n=1 Tax=Haloplanus vescus TaxID=555874 RepID=A0A1H3WT24_9EURY|nr:inorganic pyrophosphatase [Haloplanus vescus]
MFDDMDELPPSASRRSFLLGAGSVAGLAVSGQVSAADSDAQRTAQIDATNGDPMNYITDLDQSDDFPERITAVSVAQMNSREKYEYRADPHRIILDRMLHSEVRYPGDYGFIPQTAMGDGDPLDVLVMLESSLFPGCVLDVRPVAVVRMTDAGENDDKIIGVPADDPRWDHVSEVDDLPQHTRDEIAEFFRTYKNLEPDGNIVVDGFDDSQAAQSIISEANTRYHTDG